MRKKQSLRNNVGNKKSCDKSHTFIVEGVNSDIRKYIAALQRRSKCFFRSLKTFKAVLRVFVYAYDKFGQFKLDFPRLKSAVGLIQFLPSLQFRHPHPAKHLVGKAHTYTVERMNSLLRHYLARFARKTYCFSKSLQMIKYSLLLFMRRDFIEYIKI